MSYPSIANVARLYVGVPFCHQGRSVSQGLDCIGFLLLVFKECGWTPLSPETTEILNYNPDPRGKTLLRCLEKEADEVYWNDQEEGDIVLMRYGREPQHVGILLERGGGGFNLIHAVDKGVVEHIFDTSWRGRVTGIYRVKEAS